MAEFWLTYQRVPFVSSVSFGFLAALHFLRPRAALKERKAMEKAFQERHGGSCGEVLNRVSVPGVVCDTSFPDLCPVDECALVIANSTSSQCPLS